MVTEVAEVGAEARYCKKHPEEEMRRYTRPSNGEQSWKCSLCKGDAIRAQNALKLASGLCRTFSCKNPARPGRTLCEEHAKKYAVRHQERHANWVAEAKAALGGKCARCGIQDCRLTQIDHVNGDGAEEMRLWGGGSIRNTLGYKRFREWFYTHLDRYQLLCANCHVLKGIEKDDTHKTQRKWVAPSVCTDWEVKHAA